MIGLFTLPPRLHGLGELSSRIRWIVGPQPLPMAVKQHRLRVARPCIKAAQGILSVRASPMMLKRRIGNPFVGWPSDMLMHSCIHSPSWNIPASQSYFATNSRQQADDEVSPAKGSPEAQSTPPAQVDAGSTKSSGFDGFDTSPTTANSLRSGKTRDPSKEIVPAELGRLVRIARPEIKYFAVAIGLLVVTTSVSMLLPMSIGTILDAMSSNGVDQAHIFGLTPVQFCAAVVGVLAVSASASFAKGVLLRVIGERVIARLRSQLYKQILSKDAEFFDANKLGDLMSRLSSDTSVVGKSITHNLNSGLSSVITGAGGLAFMIWTSPQLTGLLGLMFPPIAIGSLIYGKAIKNISSSIQRSQGSLSKTAEERLGATRTVQAFVGENREVRRYNNRVRELFNLGRKESIISSAFFATAGFGGDIMVLTMLLFGGGLIKAGSMTIGSMMSYMMYTVYAGSGFFGLTTFYSELMKGAGAAGRLFELQDRRQRILQTVGNPVRSARGTITFKDVTFAYPNRPTRKIFDKLTFEIPEGSNCCIVGPSGSGKSSVASLLLRFYDLDSGTILIDGVDTTTLNLKTLRRRIGVVSQEPVLFSCSIAENIAYGKPDATMEDIRAAAEKANCTFIHDLPEGFVTQVGSRGSQLSGGQKQRIAIARAMLKEPDILLLDEATSALDAGSETLVNESLTSSLRGNYTIISIAHRLSTIKRADKIIVLNSRGNVAEIGSYAQLVADESSFFNSLMSKQLNNASA